MRTLKLDLDGKNGLDVFLSRRWLMKYLGLKITSVRCCHTVNGWHLYLTVDVNLSNLELVLMQTILGDDYRRAAALYSRIRAGCEDWNVLYTAKWKVNELGQKIQVSEEKYDEELSNKILSLLELGE